MPVFFGVGQIRPLQGAVPGYVPRPFLNTMNVVVENLPHCLATLKVEVEPERVSQAWSAITADFGKQVKIAGYRPGKVPRTVIEKRFKKCLTEFTA